jgi:hypothetical protein
MVAAAGFLVIASFQVALALGAPFGRAAYGGAHEGQLPTALRISSAVAVGVWVLAALTVLARAGLRVVPLPRPVVRGGLWVFVVLLFVGAAMNFASPSGWERYGWGPLALGLGVICLFVARKTPNPSSTGSG